MKSVLNMLEFIETLLQEYYLDTDFLLLKRIKEEEKDNSIIKKEDK